MEPLPGDLNEGVGLAAEHANAKDYDALGQEEEQEHDDEQHQPPNQKEAQEETEAQQRERLKADIRAHNVNVSFSK